MGRTLHKTPQKTRSILPPWCAGPEAEQVAQPRPVQPRTLSRAQPKAAHDRAPRPESWPPGRGLLQQSRPPRCGAVRTAPDLRHQLSARRRWRRRRRTGHHNWAHINDGAHGVLEGCSVSYYGHYLTRASEERFRRLGEPGGRRPGSGRSVSGRLRLTRQMAMPLVRGARLVLLRRGIAVLLADIARLREPPAQDSRSSRSRRE
eukprot:scaffold154936_cov30-Tisochrysis_lutea.AAC.3